MYKIASEVFRNSRNIFKFNFTQKIRYVSKDSAKQSPAGYSISVLFSKKYLLASNTATSGLLMLIGDLCQQELEYRQHILKKRYDVGRLTRMFIVGLGLGPLHHYYYIALAKKWPERTTKIILWKILLDQLVMSPLCIVAFFYGLNALEMKPLSQYNTELKNKFYAVYTVDWLIWPPTQYINFYFVKVKYQVLYINAVTMFYNVFLSFIKHKHEGDILEEDTLGLAVIAEKGPEH